MGKYCINRLTNSDDISGFTISGKTVINLPEYYGIIQIDLKDDAEITFIGAVNGKDYTVPWNRHEKPTDLGIPLISNTYQRNTASVNKCGEKTLQIQIKEESDGSGENKEKH